MFHFPTNRAAKFILKLNLSFQVLLEEPHWVSGGPYYPSPPVVRCILLFQMIMLFFVVRAEAARQLTQFADTQWNNSCTREVSLDFAIYTPFLRAIR